MLVRYGIKSISISNPSAIDIIYESRAGFITADSYNVLVGISNGKEAPSLVSTRDEARHGSLRRSAADAFTAQGAQEYESFVDATIPDLLNYINEGRTSQSDLAHLLMLYSIDSATRMAFSGSLGCLQADRDVCGSIELIRDRFRHWRWWSSTPWLERLFYRNWWAMRRSKGRTPSAMVTSATKKLRERLNEKKEGSSDMLKKFIAMHESNPTTLDVQGIVSLLMSTISGAGDTTAKTMTAVLYFLMKHSAELERLRAELVGVGIGKQEVPSFATTNALPYLAAVIKESMRLFPTPTWPIERLVPAGGIVLEGKLIGEGTSVGIFTPSVHLDRETFGKDVTEFRP